jgi:hypothetical protein
MDKDGSKMNSEEREYTERKSLSKLKPWYKEGSDEEAPKKILQDEKTEDEEND